jgi:hypothetical protein
MIAVFADQHVGQQASAGQPLGNRPFRCRRLMDRAAGPAAIPRPADADDPQAGRNPVEHLAHRLADRMQDTATARAGICAEVEAHVLALQMVGKAGAVRPGPGDGLLGRRRWQELFRTGNVGAEVFQAQLQLVAIETLGTSAELQTLQLLYDQPQALDLGLRLAEGRPFTRPLHRQIADQLL